MRFFCPEFSGDDFNFSDLYKIMEVNPGKIEENGLTLTPHKKTVVQTDDQPKQTLYYFGSPFLLKLNESFSISNVFTSIADFATARGITITNNTGLTSIFGWDINKLAEMKSSFIYVILTDTGVIFAKPKRGDAAKEIKVDLQASPPRGSLNELYTSFLYEGETGGDYKIAFDSDNVIPFVIDSTFKTLGMNKQKSLNDIKTIVTATDADPLDFWRDGSNYYIVVSKKEISTGKYLVQGVLENDASYSFSGANIILESSLKFAISTTLVSAGTTITLSNLTMAGKDLKLKFKFKLSGGNIELYFNGDTNSANYCSYVQMIAGRNSDNNSATVIYLDYNNDDGLAEISISINPITGICRAICIYILGSSAGFIVRGMSFLTYKIPVTDIYEIKISTAGIISEGSELSVQRVY